jgi:hypothetical protein
MRSICKKGSATLVAVLALCALAAASASAAQLYVGGKALSGKANLSKAVKVEEPIVFTSEVGSGHTLVITCKKLSVTGPKSESAELEAPSTIRFEAEYENCSVAGVGECRMEEDIFSSRYDVSLTTGTAPEDTALIGGNEKNIWIGPFVMTGGGCEGPTSFHGSLPVKISRGQTEEVEQEFVGEGKAGKGLELVGWGYQEGTINKFPPAYVTGKFKLKLESGSAWSFH